MSTQTLLGHSFPTPCKRCGGALYRQVDYCPYCGAVQPLDSGPHKRTVIPGSRASAVSKMAQTNGFDPATPGETDLTSRALVTGDVAPVELATHSSALVSPDTPIPPLAALSSSTARSTLLVRKVLYAISAVVVIGLAYVGYALFSDRDSQNGNDQSAETGTTQDSRTTTGTIALYAPTHSTRQAAAIAPATPEIPARPAQVIPPTPVMPLVAAAPVKPAAPQFHDATQAMQAVRLALRANDLSSAQAALVAAQALQPDSSDVEDLAAEMKPLVAHRESALQAAQTCAAQQSWPCARQHANEVLTIDTGNEPAKSILERVIRETGWTPLNPPAAAGVQPSLKSAAQAQTAPPTPAQMNTAVVAAAPHPAVTTPDTTSVEARERAIKDSGWNHATNNAAKPSGSTTPAQ